MSRTSHHAAAGRLAEWRRRDMGTGYLAAGGGCMPLRATWERGEGCGAGAGGSTAEPCWTAGCARLPEAPCGLASRPLGEPSARPSPAYAVWLSCSETTPAETKMG